MNPPTEQLVRDYLNRLSLAARSRLGLRDRQALLDQTRARIEAEVGGLSHATPVQVRQTLAALGDPIALVENERTKIAARKEAAIGSRFGSLANGAVRQVWPPHGAGVAHASVLATAGAEPVFDLQVPGRLPVTGGISAPASVSFSEVSAAPSVTSGSSGTAALPVQAGSSVAAGSSVPVGSSVAIRSSVPPVSSSVSVGSPASGGPPLPGLRAPAGEPGHGDVPDVTHLPGRNGVPPETLLPGPSPAPESLAGAPVPMPGRPDRPGRSGRPERPGPDGGAGSDRADESEAGVEVSISADEPAGRAGSSGWLSDASRTAAGRISRLGSGLLALAFRDRLEAVAIVLLGIGGAVYPPIWVAGAFIAISSKKWDLRDKWLGLAVPVLLVIFGAVLVMALGGQRPSLGSYAFEAWMAAGRLSRIAAVLGAGYLLRRVYRGKREPRRPPWSTPRKPG
ncbi:MAG TPA: hypothetical protein VMU94_21410 [Streptosporangiaceae bacterium]|nr:hypothetical protein [Streptosporangiaceae bacterium]